MQLIFKLKYTLLYLIAILLVSVLFTYYPALIELSPSITISPWTFIVGAWFVLRDYSQREIGHWVFIPMVIGVFICFLINPALGLASASAGIFSELTDWAIFTFTKKPFHQRVVLSSLASVVVDTVVFYWMFDFLGIIPGVEIFNWLTILVGALSKSLAVAVVYWNYRRHRVQA